MAIPYRSAGSLGAGRRKAHHHLMKTTLVDEFPNTLPADDSHPYRTGPWQPNFREHDAVDLTVEGELPANLNGLYVRNTENPVHAAIGRYHPFDGDGMLHAIRFDQGRAVYANRFVRTDGFEAERAEGRALWAGLREPPSKSERDGWGLVRASRIRPARMSSCTAARS